LEPEERVIYADDDRLDQIAAAFAQVIDAKSPWTYRHSTGVADITSGLAGVLDLPDHQQRVLRRAALVHDLGKLGVSNLILDKPGKLSPDELTEMRKHSMYTNQILQHVAGFRDLADLASAHHERLDGKGYHRGVNADLLGVGERVLAVADMYEALSARRPYRTDLTSDEVMTILSRNVGAGICPEVFDALKAFIKKGTFTPHELQQAA